MKYFRVELPEDRVHLYPIVCWHIGAKQSSEKFINHMIEKIKADPFARVIYMGDGGECVTKMSKGNIYEQTMSPGDQLRRFVEIADPIRDKILFGIRGNHGNRIDKETGVGWDELLCARMGVPYLGVSALGDLVLSHTKTAKKTCSLYVHHGTSGAISPGGKLNATFKPVAVADADIALTAHHHAAGCWSPAHFAYTDPRNSRIRYRTMRVFACGSAYDSRSGYAEEKQYPAILPEHIMVEVRSKDTPTGLGLDINYQSFCGHDDSFASEHLMKKWKQGGEDFEA